jgi:hypothetical protein
MAIAPLMACSLPNIVNLLFVLVKSITHTVSMFVV